MNKYNELDLPTLQSTQQTSLQKKLKRVESSLNLKDKDDLVTVLTVDIITKLIDSYFEICQQTKVYPNQEEYDLIKSQEYFENIQSQVYLGGYQFLGESKNQDLQGALKEIDKVVSKESQAIKAVKVLFLYNLEFAKEVTKAILKSYNLICREYKIECDEIVNIFKFNN